MFGHFYEFFYYFLDFRRFWRFREIDLAVLTVHVRDDSLLELLYADNLFLCGESLNKVMDKYRKGSGRKVSEGEC